MMSHINILILALLSDAKVAAAIAGAPTSFPIFVQGATMPMLFLRTRSSEANT